MIIETTKNTTFSPQCREPGEPFRWYVMRDLKRPNSKQPAYKMLKEQGIEVFTPMRWRLSIRQGKRIREEAPFMQDLLFVHDTRKHLDTYVEIIPTLQYRFSKGKAYCDPMVVPDSDMNRFIHAVNSSTSCQYYLPGELTPAMYGREIRIIGGVMDGYEGHLLSVRGSRTKRLLVELPSWITAAVEVKPEYIQLL